MLRDMREELHMLLARKLRSQFVTEFQQPRANLAIDEFHPGAETVDREDFEIARLESQGRQINSPAHRGGPCSSPHWLPSFARRNDPSGDGLYLRLRGIGH